MSLYARLTASDSTKIPVHPFSASLGEWATGAVTKQQLIDAFSLSAGEQTEIDAIASTYSALNATQKVGYLWKIERVFILCEGGFYTEQKAKTELGF